MTDYEQLLLAEGRKWGEHLQVEASGILQAWLDHPLVAAHYHRRSLIDGVPWMHWAAQRFGGPGIASLDLGCGSGGCSRSLYSSGATSRVEGIDISPERIEYAERWRTENGVPGQFRVADVNSCTLPPNSYDLIFSCQSFHHFVALEHIMAQVAVALTPRGLFVLDEFVGPTQFQWSEDQIHLVSGLLRTIPEKFRIYQSNGTLKTWEARPTPQEVEAVSPFEAIRSGDIAPLFARFFDVVMIRALGGTIQHLLFSGIMNNFGPGDGEAERHVRAVMAAEDVLVDRGGLPSDFALLIGMKRRSRG
ncbi:MAG: class I SAM-dependent methyltransferase [Acidobacteriota bacterium]